MADACYGMGNHDPTERLQIRGHGEGEREHPREVHPDARQFRELFQQGSTCSLCVMEEEGFVR